MSVKELSIHGDHCLVVGMTFGAHMYGLDTTNSDFDYKGVYLPSLADLIRGKRPEHYRWSTAPAHQKNNPGDKDYELMPIHRFMELAHSGSMVALDMLHCREPETTSEIWADLVELRSCFYSGMVSTFRNYVLDQTAKYGIRGSRQDDIRRAMNVLESLPGNRKLEEFQNRLHIGEFAQIKGEFYEVNRKRYQLNSKIGVVLKQVRHLWSGINSRIIMAEDGIEGAVDFKAISHAFRAGYQLREILINGDFEYPLKETPFLLEVKTGKLPYKQALNELEHLVKDVQTCSKFTHLEPNQFDWDSWLIGVYENYYNIDLMEWIT